MHPDIDKLITLALADGEVTEKEREIILRKAEKLGLDIDEVEMYLEGKISNHETVISQETTPTATPKTSTREFVLKIVQHLKPATLDKEVKYLLAILISSVQNYKISEEVDQQEEQAARLKNEIKILNDELKKERNIFEKDLKEKSDEYLKLFLEKTNPKVKNSIH